MQILLTNDDGVHAPGLAAMERQLQRLGDVTVVAPATEQSGVGHSITFLSPLVCRFVQEAGHGGRWAVNGTPADCVKLGLFEMCPSRPDLIVSGINGGLNAGINVLYSGTVAAAIEGAFFGITSIAVSLEFDSHPRFDVAAEMAANVIEKMLLEKCAAAGLYNLNIPTVATQQAYEVRIVPMGTERYGQDFVRRSDPKGRPYYWATGDPPPIPTDYESDLSALREGHVTLTPLSYDLTCRAALAEMQKWQLPVSTQD